MISLLAIAEVQKAGGTACFLDVEHAFDRNWAQKLGVNTDSLIFNQPDYGEQALTILENLVRSSAVDIVVIDSTAALVPKKELEGELGDQDIALQARMMSKAMRRLVGIVGKSSTIVIFINQMRTNPMVMYGSPDTTPGGEALKFYSSVRMKVNRMSKSEVLGKGNEILGHKVHVKVVKNKVGPPLREAELTLFYDHGVDRLVEIVDISLLREIVTQTGPTYRFMSVDGKECLKDKDGKEYKWVGVEKFKDAVRNDAVLFEALKERCLLN